METLFKAWRTSRQLHTDILSNYSSEQLNQIPNGFNNNLIWNTGHILVAQQSLVYKSSNLPMYVSDEMFNRYKPGSKPTGFVSVDEISQIKSLLHSLIEQTEKDYYSGKFKVFNERMTGTGFHLGSLKDAVEFNNYHEGLHLGYMMGLRKFIG